MSHLDMEESDSSFRFSVNRTSDAQISGYLLKQATSGNWQKRYFETSGGYLTYYKSHKMGKLLAAISIPQVGAIRRVGAVNDSKGTGVIFQIELKDRVYMLRARDEEEAQQWIDFLTDLRDGNLTQGGHNPMNAHHARASDLRKSKFQIEPNATATINKSTRLNLCGCFRISY